MGKMKLMLFSGFLGSGKTTTMIETAKYLEERGVKAALITNDLGCNMIDSLYAEKSGIPSAEIPNGCLCHDVEGFVAALRQVTERYAPDVIFAEPVGSCVDLVRSVYCRLNADYAGQYELLPFVAVTDPRRYRTIFLAPEENTFNAEATYMYRKQLEDADIILLNKCDLISGEERAAVEASLKKEFPSAQVIPVCAFSRENYGRWTAAFLRGQAPSLRELDINWDYLIAGEEHMGWYNNVLRLSAPEVKDFNAVLDFLMKELQRAFAGAGTEIAHLKIMCYTGRDFAKAALTGTAQPVFFSERMNARHRWVDCNINARVIAKPEDISRIIGAALEKTAAACGVSYTDMEEQSFGSFSEAPAPVSVR